MGQDEYRLKSMADDQLLSGLARIVHRRNQITAEFLAYLAELDERQLFLDLGYSSLFEYCVETLKLCESTAGRHIAAARVCRNHPEAFAMVARGALHASALSVMRKHLTPENADALFALCTHRSTRKVEELLAERFPRPDVRDLVRRLPAKAVTLDVERSAEPAEIAESSRERPTDSLEKLRMESLSRVPLTDLEKAPVATQCATAREAARLRAPLVARGAAEASRPGRFEPLSADRYGVHFTADGEFCALLERVRGLAGHRLPSGDLLTLLKRGLEAYERELEKERFAVGRKTRLARELATATDALPAHDVPKPARSACELSTPDAPKAERSKHEPSKGDVPKPARSACARSTPDVPKAERSKHEPSTELFVPEPTKSELQRNSIPNSRWSRRVPAEVVRAVFLRDEGRCSFVSRDGRQCGARRCLELDHIEPLAVGGEATVENLRLRCRAHNQWYARQYFGASRVKAAIQRSRRARTLRGQGRLAEC